MIVNKILRIFIAHPSKTAPRHHKHTTHHNNNSTDSFLLLVYFGFLAHIRPDNNNY